MPFIPVANYACNNTYVPIQGYLPPNSLCSPGKKIHIMSWLCNSLLGYLILAGKVRTPTEEDSIRTTLEKHFKRTVNIPSLFGYGDQTSLTTANIVNSLQQSVHSELFSHLVWTQDLMRLAVLLGRSIQFDEPVLLVGETG